MNKKYLSFFSYLKKHRFLILVIVLLAIIQTIFTTISFLIIPDIIFSLDPDSVQKVSPITQSNMLDYVGTFKNYITQLTANLPYLDRVIYMAIIVILVYLAKNIIDYLRRVLTAWFEISVVTDMRNDLFTHIQNLSITDHAEKEKGHYLSLLTRDITQVFISMKRVFESLLTQPLLILSLLYSIFNTSWRLSALIIIAAPITGLLLVYIGKSLRRKSQRVMKQGDDYLNILNESFQGFKIFKAFNAERFQQNRFIKEILKLKRLTFLQSVVQSINIPLTEILGSAVVAGVLVLGAYISVSGEGLTGKEIVTVLIGLIAMIEPIKKIGEVYNELKVAMVSVDRVFDILQLESDENQFGNLEHEQFESDIEINIAKFNYDASSNFELTDIKFEIKKGETVALVGASGCGKSTLADLLSRFYRIENGYIKIDGININELSNQSLRNLISIVPQQSFLLRDTIETNIRFNQDENHMDDVVEAAKMANATEFIDKFDDAYAKNVGDNGSKLSGGQRQRITIARAILKQTPIIILDEATAALDSKSEKVVQNALDNMMKNHTTLVIAHRLNTIINASKIIVMDQGKIVEAGTHNQLIKNNSLYKKLYDIQYMNADS